MTEMDKRIELEMLVCEREGYVAENRLREIRGEGIGYALDSFLILAEKMRVIRR